MFFRLCVVRRNYCNLYCLRHKEVIAKQSKNYENNIFDGQHGYPANPLLFTPKSIIFRVKTTVSSLPAIIGHSLN